MTTTFTTARTGGECLNTYLLKHGEVGNDLIADLACLANLAPERIKLTHQVFANCEDGHQVQEMADALSAMLHAAGRYGHTYIETSEHRLELFIRWYLYQERSPTLVEAIASTLACDLEPVDNYLSEYSNTARRRARLGYTWPSLQQVSYLSWMSVVFSAPSYTAEHLSQASCARFLGAGRHPVDFVHHAPHAREAAPFLLDSDVQYTVTQTIAVARALMLLVSSPQEHLWEERRARLLKRLDHKTAELRALGGAGEALQVAHELRESVLDSQRMEQAFMDFAIDWIRAVHKTFKWAGD